MTWTLIVLWYLGTSAGTSLVVPRIPTLAACEALLKDMPRPGGAQSFARCVETLS